MQLVYNISERHYESCNVSSVCYTVCCDLQALDLLGEGGKTLSLFFIVMLIQHDGIRDRLCTEGLIARPHKAGGRRARLD